MIILILLILLSKIKEWLTQVSTCGTKKTYIYHVGFKLNKNSGKFTGNEMLRFEKMSICVIDLYVLIVVTLLYFIYTQFIFCKNVWLVNIDQFCTTCLFIWLKSRYLDRRGSERVSCMFWGSCFDLIFFSLKSP